MSTTAAKRKIDNFQDLRAWQTSKALAIKIYQVTKTFPATEQFGLTSQMRRSSVSISSNIAEGFSRKTKKDKQQFYQTALGSVTELQSQLEIAQSVGLVSKTDCEDLKATLIKSHKLINGLIKSAGDWHVKHT